MSEELFEQLQLERLRRTEKHLSSLGLIKCKTCHYWTSADAIKGDRCLNCDNSHINHTIKLE